MSRRRTGSLGLSASGRQAPSIPATTADATLGRRGARELAIVARPNSPSTTATLRKIEWSGWPQWGIASMAKCEATPSPNAVAGRGTKAPMTAPATTWLVISTLGA